MRSLMIRALVVVVLAALCVPARAQAPDKVLVDGKIITLDGVFTIAQALAIRGQRIVAVGTTAEIEKLKGPATETIDLNGRTVIPGLIDNHAHWIRAAEHWHQEVRLDGVTTRAQAIKMLTERVAAARPGDWIVTLGGWSEEQFTDDARGFPLAELDRIAPNNPVVLQAVYNHSYLNSAAMKLAKVDEKRPIRLVAASRRMRAVSRPAWCATPAASPSSRRRCRCRKRRSGSKTPGSLPPSSTPWASPPGSMPAAAA